MAKFFYTHLNLNGNELLNAVIHKVTALPASGAMGQLCYNTTDNLMYQYDGSNWQVVGGVTSFGGQRGAIGVGNGLQMTGNTVNAKVDTTPSAGVELSVDTDGIKVTTTTLDTDEDITTDATSVVSGKGVRDAINALDSTADLNYGLQTIALDNATKQLMLQQVVSEVDGKIATGGQATTLYFTKDVTSGDPLVVKSDLSGIVGALVYKGTCTAPGEGETAWSTNPNVTVSTPEQGWLYVVNGDATVESGTTLIGKPIPAGTYTNGDMFAYNGTSWDAIEGNVPVENKATTLHFGEGLQEVAVVNGTQITVGIQQVTAADSGNGNAVSGVSVTNGHITVTKANFIESVTDDGETGVVTGVTENIDGTSIVVTHTDLTYDGLTNVQYLTNISQDANGQITATGDNFDSTVPDLNPSTTNAPTTSAVKTYVDNSIDALNADKTSDDAAVATVEVVETGGVITDVVVSTISADVSATTTAGTNPTISATTGTGAVTGGDIATIKSYVDAKTAYDIQQLDVAGFEQASIGDGNITINGIKEVDGEIATDTTKSVNIAYDGTYDATDNKLATQSTVTNAINTLDVTGYQQMFVNNKTTGETPSNGSIVVSGIQEVGGIISASGSTTLNVDRGLDITSGAIGHTNSVTAQTTGLGSSASNATKVVTGLTFDAQGHITAAGETALVAANIANTASGNLQSTNIQAALEELQGDIDTITTGTAFKGEFTGTGAEFAAKTGEKIGNQYIYQGTVAETILTKNVEPGDLIIVKTVDAQGHPTAIVVVERSLDKAVTNASTSLTTDKLVLGAGNNDTVKTSDYGVSETAILAAGTGNDTDILTSKAVVDTIANKITNLDATVSQTADTANGMLALSLTEVDGKVTAISGSVAASDGYQQLNFNGNAVTLATIAGITIDAKLDTLASVAADTAGGVQLTETDNALSASLIDNAVTTAKIADGNVTIAKIADANLAIGTATGATNDKLTTQDYVDEKIASAIVARKKALTFDNDNNAEIGTSTSNVNFADTTIVEIRDTTNQVVECDVTYAAAKITIHVEGTAPSGLYAIVHAPASYTIS